MTTEEREILDSFEKGEWKSIQNIETRKEEFAQYARATIRKDKRVKKAGIT